ncbi:MAG: hypothetical protein LLG06_04660 [Desulfobacteraceae bacterium]|nr:hypothetical protein [Desulfobacteraceae bacterium]
MAEIKSTIDLIMERTRHLTMSEEDRREQAASEFKAAVNRLILQFLDGGIDLDKFAQEFNAMERSAGNVGLAIAEAARRIDPAGDNRMILDLLRFGLNADISQISAVLDGYRKALDGEDLGAMERMVDRLFQKGITGSAVIPNLRFDEKRAGRRKEIEQQFQNDLQSALARAGGR